MRLILPAGLFLSLLRIGGGVFDNSGALLALGLWSGFTVFEIQAGLAESTRSFSGEKKPILYLVLLVFFATFLLGLEISAVKTFFQIYLGTKEELPGTPALIMVIFSGILWEGGFLLSFPAMKEQRLLIRFSLLIALILFLSLASIVFFKGHFFLLDPLAGGLIVIILFVHVFKKIVSTLEMFVNS